MNAEKPKITLTIDQNIWIPLQESDCTIVVRRPVDGAEQTFGDSEWYQTVGFGQKQLTDRSDAKGKAATDHPIAVQLESALRSHQSDLGVTTSLPLEALVNVEINITVDSTTLRWNKNARAIITRCNGGQCISATLRFPKKVIEALHLAEGDTEKKDKEKKDKEKKEQDNFIRSFNGLFSRRVTPWKSSQTLLTKQPDTKFFLQTDYVADVLLNYVFDATDVQQSAVSEGLQRALVAPLSVNKEKTGVLVFAGATKCGKSEAATSTILRYLWALPTEKNPSKLTPRHLVTAEDPPEAFKVYCDESIEFGPEKTEIGESMDYDSPFRFGIWMTRRHLGKDVPSLQLVYKNALRQTPACVFVGETRDPEDWQTILELGSTGHLVVTTMHAGSITEAMSRIMKAQNVSTAFQRVNLARTILGICHMGRFDVKSASHVLPALWRQTSMSIAAFGTDGLASMVPNKDYLLGRHAFAIKALERVEKYGCDKHKDHDSIMEQCQVLDLTEM